MQPLMIAGGNEGFQSGELEHFGRYAALTAGNGKHYSASLKKRVNQDGILVATIADCLLLAVADGITRSKDGQRASEHLLSGLSQMKLAGIAPADLDGFVAEEIARISSTIPRYSSTTLALAVIFKSDGGGTLKVYSIGDCCVKKADGETGLLERVSALGMIDFAPLQLNCHQDGDYTKSLINADVLGITVPLSYPDNTFNIKPGETILLTTDGIQLPPQFGNLINKNSPEQALHSILCEQFKPTRLGSLIDKVRKRPSYSNVESLLATDPRRRNLKDDIGLIVYRADKQTDGAT